VGKFYEGNFLGKKKKRECERLETYSLTFVMLAASNESLQLHNLKFNLQNRLVPRMALRSNTSEFKCTAPTASNFNTCYIDTSILPVESVELLLSVLHAQA
jgi:thiamine pyrophosphokinase